MTDQELRDHLTEWTKDYCRDDFDDGLPAGVKMFIEKGFEFYKKRAGKVSESLGDYSVTYEKVDDFLPASLVSLLRPYRRMRGVK